VAGLSGRQRRLARRVWLNTIAYCCLLNAVKFYIGDLCLLCRLQDGSALSALLRKCSFILAYVAGITDQCMGFRE